MASRSRSDGSAAAAGALEHLQREILACRICRDHPLGRRLSHEPRPVVVPSSTARIAICGQAPGARVHMSGVPFTDASGDRLRTWMDVTPAEFYDASRIAIVPMGFCFPGNDANGGDLPPRKECARTWHDRLFDLMPQLDLVVLVGSYAQAWHLGARRGSSVTVTVERWREVFTPASAGARQYFPLPHPSWRNTGWLKANPWFETDVLPVLRTEVRRRLPSPAAD